MKPGHFPYAPSNSKGMTLSGMSNALGMPARQAAKERGYNHIEAFALMHYECKSCIHREVIWNSRDGVTAFGTTCPSCGALEFNHANFGADWCVPDHVPHRGQRVWISMTQERAMQIARTRVLEHKRETPETLRLIEHVAESIYHGGDAPDMVICGYGWNPPKKGGAV